mgnify:CR=1 FL=1
MNAFSSLEEKKKKELLMNAKLKDELALQSIGITNLSARLTKQTEMNEKIRSDIGGMEKRARILRVQLAALHKQENARLEDYR